MQKKILSKFKNFIALSAGEINLDIFTVHYPV